VGRGVEEARGEGERRGGGVGRRRRLQWTCIKSNGSSATSSKSLTDPSLSCSNIFCAVFL
jgi:hypothetical protein